MGSHGTDGQARDQERDSKTRLSLTPPPPKAGVPRAPQPETSSFTKTQLGLPLPGKSSAGAPIVNVEAAPADGEGSGLRSTRPGWIAVALQGGAPLVDGKVNLLPGNVIPGTRYRIERWLGEGGMGVVYEAQHLDLERRVALKVLRADACGTPQAIKMFRDEARTASRIGSDYITQIFDFAELSDGRLLFAMELLKGASLSDELRAGPIEPSRVIAILRQVCKGLSAAHAAGIIHRDIKPENIFLVRRTGRHDAVKLLDFGVSTIADDQAQAEAGVAGTAYYVAPELVAGVPYDTRVDMYALGCTAYEMLTGRPPFDNKVLEQLLLCHVEDEVEPPSTVHRTGNIPKGLETVVMRCLAKHPDHRYRDMADLEAALCEAQIAAQLSTTWDDLPLPDVDPDRRDFLLRKMPDPSALLRKRRFFWPAVAGLAACAAVGMGFVVVQGNQPTAAEQNSVEELTAQARSAAQLAYYVYPPADSEGVTTAYAAVRELEALGFERARTRANELRVEFGSALTALGDRYWEEEGGKSFALDYYVQALVFSPEDAAAAERARMTPGQLLALQGKAEGLSFSEDELIAAEPLVALAEDDPEARAEKLAALDESGHLRSGMIEDKLARLEGRRSPAAAKRAAAEAKATPDVSATASDAGETGGVVEDGAETGAAEEVVAEKKLDPHRAQRIAEAGLAELQSGKSTAAEELFQQSLAEYPRNAEALGGLGKIYFDKAKYSRAASYLKRAVRAAPRNADYRIRLGDAYYKLFRYEDAKRHYEKAESLGHSGAVARVKRASSKLAG